MEQQVDASRIRAIVLDVDGVLTDGSVLAMENGDQVRIMNIKDGYALQLAVRLGYVVAVISGGRSEGVAARLRGLGIQHVFMGVGEKLPVFERFRAEMGLAAEEMLYIGDDMPDFPVLEAAGIGVAPADAAEDILKKADWVTHRPGGKGCVREVLETVLKQQGRWYASESFIW